MSDMAASASITTPPHEVDECRGVLRVYSDVSIWRSSKPSFNVPVNDDGSILWKDIVFDPVHDLQLRLYKPASPSSPKLPVFYYIHGGGFCIGSRAWPNCQNYCFRLASNLQAVVISPDYRLAPENRLPAAIEDGFMAMKWLQSQALANNPDPWLTDVADFSKVFISGDSAGGNIAHNLAVQLGAGSLDLAPVLVRGYVLLAPFFGGTVLTRSEAEGPKDAFLNLELIDLASNLINKPRSTKRDIFMKHSISYIPKTPNDHKKEFEEAVLKELLWERDNLVKHASPFHVQNLTTDIYGMLLELFWRLSVPMGETTDHPLINPFGPVSRHLEQVNLDPILVVVGGNDLLKDRGKEYAERLKNWGKKIEYVEFEGQQHGFFTIDPNSEPAKALMVIIKRFIVENSS
ncbi:hypothetical protein GOBAR_AA04858 [Gossypium barbadense]|uniref:Alpha/beta hydrolase fold-3 domain-containing protein n=1 Tax=Gossypium barbadense TaxID=3634 RepID=A0A2P5YJE4_GOSBA|nr:hypothetical protein GOBAR_AA04858 [Gossypium barbadense]